MENNFSVYQHVTPDNMYYFGATQNVERRWSRNGAEYKGTALQPYIEKYGWENIQHIVLFENQSKEDALSIEDSLIISGWEKGNCINQQRSGNISKEEGYYKNQAKQYYEENKDKRLEYQHQYYEENKQQIQEQKQQYYEQNKKQILEQHKEYREQNKQQILEQKKQYYEENKKQIREQQKQYYEENKKQIKEQKKQYYQRKKEEQQLKELGCLPLW